LNLEVQVQHLLKIKVNFSFNLIILFYIYFIQIHLFDTNSLIFKLPDFDEDIDFLDMIDFDVSSFQSQGILYLFISV
jgi:hypothetical protein